MGLKKNIFWVKRMNTIILDNKIRYLKQLETIFPMSEITRFLLKNNFGIVIILDYVKARDWPRRNRPLKNKPIEKIPLLWGFFHALDDEQIEMTFDIHPAKCFPNLYNANNPNSRRSFMPVVKNNGYTLAGCSRNFVEISGYKYKVWDKTPDYCAIFGLPDDCYSSKFEENMLDILNEHKKLKIWCFEETEYIPEKIGPIASLNYMKGGFLPHRHFIYIDTAANFLKGIYSQNELERLNSEVWYASGRDFIEDMNLNNPEGYNFEEQAIYYIKKRLIFEFVRLSLLLRNKDSFTSFIPISPPLLDFKIEQEFLERFETILQKFKKNIFNYLNKLLNKVKNILDMKSFKRSRFLVTDLEFIHVLYPTGSNARIFNFPCIFSSIIWQGPREGFMTDINVFKLPCHFCTKHCSSFKNRILNFDCLTFGFQFIKKQQTMIEYLLARYEGFKVYSYGRSDVFQLEQGINFFTDSFEIQEYERRNRKRTKRITQVSEDLAITGKSLKMIEDEILKKWLIGWERKEPKKRVNRRFMTNYNSQNWEPRYVEAINSVIGDNISAFLFLLYKKYRNSNKNVKFRSI